VAASAGVSEAVAKALVAGPIIAAVCMEVGGWITGVPTNIDSFDFGMVFSDFGYFMSRIFIPYGLGGIGPGLICAFISYHLLRPLVGARPSALLPAAALGGASMLLAADVATRLLAPADDLKLGVLTALVGAPFFLRLIAASRRGDA
jgi:hypothetical protein